MSKMYVLNGVNYGRNLMDKIPDAPNFQYWEFVSSQTAVRNGIANIPNEQEWSNIEHLAKTVLQPLRIAIGQPLNINSGFRCKQLNDLAGSSDASFHRLGCAADVDSDTVPLMKILEIAHSLPYTELIAEYFPNGWVHIGLQKGRTDQTLKLKDDKHHFARVNLDYIKGLYS